MVLTLRYKDVHGTGIDWFNFMIDKESIVGFFKRWGIGTISLLNMDCSVSIAIRDEFPADFIRYLREKCTRVDIEIDSSDEAMRAFSIAYDTHNM